MEWTSVCVDFVSPHVDSRIFVYDLAVGFPALLFLLYLAWNLKPSLRKLQRSQSNIMATYYVFLWAVSLLNLLRCCVQIAQTHGKHPVLWNVLWLVTRFGMMVLEVSVVVFLLHGYVSSGREALIRTLCTSGVLSGLDTVIKALYIFAFHVPLFLFGGTPSASIRSDMTWSKWSFWLLHALLFSAVYCSILVLPLSRWRDLLPAKPSFYRYVRVLLVLYLVSAFSSVLIGSKVVGGYCVYAVANWVYYALYPPLLYLTFLFEFFADEELDIDMMYYSEMRDAGCFDVDFQEY